MKRTPLSPGRLERRLRKIQADPRSLAATIACCYVSLGSEFRWGDRALYLCPVCRELTVLDDDEVSLARNLWKIHEFEKRMREEYGFFIQLDERFLCVHCRPPEMEAPGWIIEFDGRRFTRKMDDDDIELLTAFFQKKRIYDTHKPRNEHPDVVGRLRVLFGLQEEGEVESVMFPRRQIAALSILPETAVLEMTWQCNHQCLFCSCPWYAGMIPQGRELDTAEWKELIAEYAANGVTTFAFTGGEALLRSDLPEILEFAAAQRVRKIEYERGTEEFQIREGKAQLVLLSNGCALHDEMLRFCRDHEIHLSLSLPGLDSFPLLTGGGTTAQHVLERLRKAAEYGLHPTAAITVTAINIHELYETIAAALTAGADSILLNRFLPGGRGLAHPELNLTPTQIQEMFLVADFALNDFGKDGHVGTETPRCIWIDLEGYHRLRIGSRCAAAHEFFVTGPSGMIRVCNHSPRELLYWRKWRELKDHPVWQEYAFRRYLPEECTGCDMISECAAGCRAAADVTTGSSKGLEPCLREFLEKASPIEKRRRERTAFQRRLRRAEFRWALEKSLKSKILKLKGIFHR